MKFVYNTLYTNANFLHNDSSLPDVLLEHFSC